MRRKIIVFIILFVLVVLQTAFVPRFFNSGSAPNLILILVVFLSSRTRLEKIWKLIAVAGILADIFLFLPLGTNTLAFLLVSLGVKVLERKFFIIHTTWRFFILVALVAFFSWMYEAILPFLVYAARNKFLSGYHFAGFEKEIEFLVLYSVIFFAILYRPLLRIEDFLRDTRNLPETQIFREGS